MTPESLLNTLRCAISPPTRPDDVLGELTSSRIGPGLHVPPDYRHFLDIYGPGAFMEGDIVSLRVYDVITEGRDDAFESTVLLEKNNLAHRLDPKKMYPDKPGLLPWGDFEQGYTFYWLIDGRADRWKVVVDARSEFIVYDMGMLEFLVRNVTVNNPAEFFDDGADRFTGYCTLTQCKRMVNRTMPADGDV